MKKYTKVCIALLLALLMLVSCSNPADGISKPTVGTSNPAGDPSASTGNAQKPVMDNHELIVPIVDECRVSSKRTGTERQGVYGANIFEVTDTGSYWQCSTAWGTWLLYSDHGSDEVIKLCGRPDCTHSTKDCNAWFDGHSICYYEGYLYILVDSIFTRSGIYRVNLDGTERLLVLDLGAFKGEHGARGAFGGTIVNGIFYIELKTLDENGKEVYTAYYYKLDGSMEKPEEANMSALFRTDGDVFCAPIGYDRETDEEIYGTWDPDTNTTTELFRTPEFIYGYYGSEALYYMEDGIIYEYTYATGDTAALCDTGLTDWPYYQVYCFPDTVVVTNYAPSDPSLGVDDPDVYMLHFYDWNFNHLGSVAADYPYHGTVSNVICGETHERFMLTDYVGGVPRYYIEKSDLGTGNIILHEYELDFPYYSETGVSSWHPDTGEGYGEGAPGYTDP